MEITIRLVNAKIEISMLLAIVVSVRSKTKTNLTTPALCDSPHGVFSYV